MGLDIYIDRNKHNELAYFRKVNFLVGYFLGDDYDDSDNLSPVVIDKEQVEELIDICKQVLEKKDDEYSMEVLPPTGGFFFGKYEIDEDYYRNVEYVKEIFEEQVLPEFDTLEDDETITIKCWW